MKAFFNTLFDIVSIGFAMLMVTLLLAAVAVLPILLFSPYFN